VSCWVSPHWPSPSTGSAPCSATFPATPAPSRTTSNRPVPPARSCSISAASTRTSSPPPTPTWRGRRRPAPQPTRAIRRVATWRRERRPRRPPRPHSHTAAEGTGLHGQQDEPARPGPGPELHRDHGLVQHSREQAADAESTARQGGADRFLDVLVHQLPARPAPRGGLVQRLQEGRLGRGGRVGTGIRLRARGLQRRERRGQPRHRLPGRRGRQPGDLGRLQQRVLAGGIPHRPDGHRARL
jgi:hypothetical protein